MKENTSEKITLPRFPDKNPYTAPYFFKDNIMCMVEAKKDSSGKFIEKTIEICRAVDITKIFVDIDTGRVTVTIEFYFAGKVEKKVFPRETMASKRNLENLITYGADVAEPVVDSVLKYLNKKERYIPWSNIHTQLGWGWYKNKPIFKLHSTVGIDSAYQGGLNLEPKGFFEGWCDVIRQHVIGHLPLQLALAVGLSSIILAYIAKLTGLETMLFHIYGESTKGKTTALRLAVSPFGLPATHDNGLIRTWDNTNNALQELFKGNFGVPVALDEASVRVGEDMTKMVYNFASGKGRGRLNRDCELKQTAEWSTTMISTGECSLIQNCVRNTGIKMRLIEFANIDWTLSAEHAEAIQQGILENYGHAAPILAKYLIEQGLENVVQRWKELSQICYEAFENLDAFSQRKANKIAVILLTIECAAAAFNLEFDIDGIFELLLKIEQDSADTRNLGEAAYNFFLEACAQNISSFSTDDHPSRAMQHWGSYTKNRDATTEICILPTPFKELMAKGGFQDTNVILGHWRTAGLIDCDHDGKFTRKRVTIPGTSAVRVHVVKVKKELQEQDTEIRQRPRTPKAARQQRYQS